MKRLFFGLAVAIVALSASAFTNAKSEVKSGRFASIYVTGVQFDPLTSTTYYTYNTSGEGVSCDASASPCEIEAKSGYSLPASRFPVSDYNTTNFDTHSEQPQL